MTLTIRNLLAAAAVAVMPITANAIPLAPGQSETKTFIVDAGGSAAFGYEVVTPVTISIIAIGGSDTSAKTDLEKVMFGYGIADTPFTYTFAFGPNGAAVGSLPSWVANSSFMLNFTAFGTAGDVGITYSFQVSEAPAVPLPAAGMLLVGALGGIAALGRRKKTKA